MKYYILTNKTAGYRVKKAQTETKLGNNSQNYVTVAQDV